MPIRPFRPLDSRVGNDPDALSARRLQVGSMEAAHVDIGAAWFEGALLPSWLQPRNQDLKLRPVEALNGNGAADKLRAKGIEGRHYIAVGQVQCPERLKDRRFVDVRR